MFWNIGGFKKLYDLDSETIDFLTRNEIICFSETFISHDSLVVPNWLNNYIYFMRKAVKINIRGRASGGLITFIKKDYFQQVTMLYANDLGLFIRVSTEVFSITIGNIYWKPDLESDDCIKHLEEAIACIRSSKSSDSIILGGDWNARIGQLNQHSDELFEGSNLKGYRDSLDTVCNVRGRKLVECMENEGLFVLNGRTRSDCPAQYTDNIYSGSSIVDTLWVSPCLINHISDMEIVALPELSTHLPVLLHLKNIAGLSASSDENIGPLLGEKIYLNMNEVNVTKYLFLLSQCRHIYFNSSDTNSLYMNLLQCFKSCALEANLIKIRKNPVKKNH